MRGHLSLIALCGSFAGAGMVSAQDMPQVEENEAGGLEDIVVTAQKRSERLQDVPIAVTVFSGEALSAKGVTNVMDLITVAPGLTYTQIIGTASPRIRGIGTSASQSGLENSVSTYVDGVYYASASSSVLSLNNIEQISVLKGPQGTLFGRNATGGLIQITTRDPEQSFSGNMALGYGNNDTIDATLYATGGITPTLAADVAVYYHNQRDGYGRNLTTGSEVSKTKDLNFRSKWKLQAGDDTVLTLGLDYGRLRGVLPSRRPTYDSLPTPGPRFTGGKFDIYTPVDPYYRNDQGGVSLNATHHFGDLDLVSITAYREAKTEIFFQIFGTTAQNSTSLNHNKDRQFSQEIQLVSTGSGPLKWNIGAFYFKYKGGYYDIDFNIPPLTQNFTTEQQTESVAGYAQATYKLSEATSFTGGIRYTRETKDFDGTGTITTRASGAIATFSPISGRITYQRPTWRLALDHHLDEDILVYASYNRGFKSGGFNPSVFNSLQPIKPETLDAYEIGLKSDLLDRKLRINGAAFYYDYSNIQLTRFVDGLPILTNGPTAKIYGLDADLTARPADSLTLTAGISYIHARFGSFPGAQFTTPLPGGGNLVFQGDARGNRLPLTPDWTLDLGADYEILLPRGSLLISAQYFHNDGWFAEAENRLRQKAYDMFGGSVRWNVGDDQRLSLTAWGKNLTNQAIATQFQAQAQADNITVGAGRSFGVTAGLKF